MKPSRQISPRQVASSILELSNLSDMWLRDHVTQEGEEAFYTHFAIDADVVRMFLMPDEEWALADIFWRARPEQLSAPKEEDRRKVLTQEDETAQLLARLIADFVFADDSVRQSTFRDRSFLVIPPHNDEIASMLIAIANDTQASSRRLESKIRGVSETLGRIFDSYRSTGDPKAFAENLARNAPEVVKLYSVLANSATALDRFVSIGSKRLSPLSRLRTQMDESVNDLLPPNFGARIEDQAVFWLGKLFPQEERSSFDPENPSKDEDKLRSRKNDARVLATLDLLNETLFDRRERVMLLTATPHLLQGLKGVCLENRNYDSTGQAAFVDLFLRHPRWVISDPDFFFTKVLPETNTFPETEASPKDGINLQRWLDILASGKEYQGELLSDSSHELQNIPSEWNSVIRMLATLRYGESLGDVDWSDSDDTRMSTDVLKKLIKIADSVEWKKNRLAELMRQPATDSVSRLYTTSTVLGLFEQAKEGSVAARVMPALCFDPPYTGFHTSYTKLRTVLREIHTQKTANMSAIQGVFDEMRADEDITSYHRHIIHAAAYAMFENWGPVITLCQLAIRIADNAQKSPIRGKALDVIRGREAAFLAAIASRRSAKTSSFLKPAKYFLEEAIKRDPDRKDPPDIRFRSERAAIDIREIYFKYFDAPSPDVAASAVGHFEILERLISEANTLTAGDVPADGTHDICPYISEWVLIQTYSNLFSLLLIGADAGRTEIFSEKYGNLLDQFATFMREKGEIYAGSDPYNVTVCDLALVVSGRARGKVVEITKALARRIEKGTANDATYAPRRRDMFQRLLSKYGIFSPVGVHI